MPVIIGRIGDVAGLRGGMMFLYLTFAVVFSVGFWARPLINNSTVRVREAPQDRRYTVSDVAN